MNRIVVISCSKCKVAIGAHTLLSDGIAESLHNAERRGHDVRFQEGPVTLSTRCNCDPQQIDREIYLRENAVAVVADLEAKIARQADEITELLKSKEGLRLEIRQVTERLCAQDKRVAELVNERATLRGCASNVAETCAKIVETFLPNEKTKVYDAVKGAAEEVRRYASDLKKASTPT